MRFIFSNADYRMRSHFLVYSEILKAFKIVKSDQPEWFQYLCFIKNHIFVFLEFGIITYDSFISDIGNLAMSDPQVHPTFKPSTCCAIEKMIYSNRIVNYLIKQ